MANNQKLSQLSGSPSQNHSQSTIFSSQYFLDVTATPLLTQEQIPITPQQIITTASLLTPQQDSAPIALETTPPTTLQQVYAPEEQEATFYNGYDYPFNLKDSETIPFNFYK
ncbi:12322_t:CDS:1, partial [Acaulospora morrowiae]